MRKIIRVKHGGKVSDVAWLSFQTDGSISFGLKDRAYIAPRLRERIGLWNVYNRQTIAYVLPSNPKALLPVQNPHFTYHPRAMFHLKANTDRKAKDEAIFEGFADVEIALMQDEQMPWIRATSAPLSRLPLPKASRADKIETSELVAEAPAIFLDLSARIEVDFILQDNVELVADRSTWAFAWGRVGLRIVVNFAPPQIATLGWFHSY